MDGSAASSANSANNCDDVTGFAGSERAGERRRRRLAVESEGSAAEVPGTSGNGDPLSDFFDDAGREASQLTARDCPVLTIVSAPSWKHWVVVLLGLATGLGVLVAGYLYPQWASGHGPGVARIFQSPASPIIAWATTLLLFTTAQAAWIVWWARSRSLKDFHGSYRIWGWAAATWLLLSFASASQAHLAWSETILHHVRWRTPGAMLWCWLLPASIWGWGLALRLEQELRDDRPAHWLFLTAGAWYLGVVAILCQREFWPEACAAELTQLLLGTLPLLGHASLFLSTALHARYVLSCTAEPPAARRRVLAKSAERASQKSSWLRPAWLFRSSRSTAQEDGEDRPKRGRKRASPTKKRAPQRKSTRVSKVAGEEEAWDETTEGDWDSEGTSAEAADSTGKKYRIDDAEEPGGDHFAGAEDDESDDLKGLSKRDRRKLQQQMREQERRGGR
jgi:hypothetical protein